MRVRQVQIDGYGRFTGQELRFEPGLQVIVGPNEQGKSTLRCFITDMLYGQRQGLSEKAFVESNDLRTPWQPAERYGGRLTYVLDSGEAFVADRTFTRGLEALRLCTEGGDDITGVFRRLATGEADFAGTHLGLARPVFIGVATIGHLGLDGLGDEDALARIREKLSALADSGSENASSASALALLAERVQALGGGDDRTRPLPSARARLVLLDHELTQARAQRGQLAQLRVERHALREELVRLRSERDAVDAALTLLEHHARAARLREAEALQDRIDTATKHCFALSAVREFPLDRLGEVRQAENLYNTARLERDRTVREESEAAAQLEAERAHLGGEPPTVAEAPPELLARRSAAREARAEAARALAAGEARLTEAEAGLAAAQEAVAALPDFARQSPDPVEWITQLVTSFDVARRARDEETAQREKLRSDLDRRRAAIAESHALFKEHKDFTSLAREYELDHRVREEQQAQRSSLRQTLAGQREEAGDKLVSYRLLAVLLVFGVAALGVTWFFTRKPALFIPLGVVSGAVLFYGANVVLLLKRVASLDAQLAEANAEPDAPAEPPEPDVVDRLLDLSGCATVRELEALFEEYREASAELTATIEHFHAQEERAEEAEERMPRLLAHYRQTFEKLGETIAGEEDVQRAASSAIGRYQAYREAKRRVTEQRAAIDRAQGEVRRLRTALGEADGALAAVDEEAGVFLAGCGFDVAAHDGPGAALDAFLERNAALRDRRTRVAVLEERAEALARRRAEDEEALADAERRLQALLSEAGVSSVAQWQVVAKQAEEYRDVWERRANLERELAELLVGQDLGELRREVAALGPLADPPEASREALAQRRAELAKAIETGKEQEHGLHVTLTERGGGMRPVAEIEEDRAAAAARVAALEAELESTTYAMALIEEVARDRHARIAPELARRAGAHLADITGGAYGEMRIGPNLDIGVSIPEHGEIAERPDRFLSKGTVDQVYLALRLALTQCIGETGESVPMLLDDPLANYDDARLERTMRLLAELGGTNQVFLFTCREDVVRAAEAVQAPVLRL